VRLAAAATTATTSTGRPTRSTRSRSESRARQGPPEKSPSTWFRDPQRGGAPRAANLRPELPSHHTPTPTPTTCCVRPWTRTRPENPVQSSAVGRWLGGTVPRSGNRWGGGALGRPRSWRVAGLETLSPPSFAPGPAPLPKLSCGNLAVVLSRLKSAPCPGAS
jgi:hypothetical protein